MQKLGTLKNLIVIKMLILHQKIEFYRIIIEIISQNIELKELSIKLNFQFFPKVQIIELFLLIILFIIIKCLLIHIIFFIINNNIIFFL